MESSSEKPLQSISHILYREGSFSFACCRMQLHKGILPSQIVEFWVIIVVKVFNSLTLTLTLTLCKIDFISEIKIYVTISNLKHFAIHKKTYFLFFPY